MNDGSVLRVIAIGLLSLGGVLALIWIASNFELAEHEVRSGYSKEATRNPFLAAERFLRRIDRDVASIPSSNLWLNLPGRDDVLVIYRYVPPTGAERQQLLREWIETGGHLIVGADGALSIGKDQDRRIPGLLAELGVRVVQRGQGFMPTAAARERIEIPFEELETPLSVTMSNQRYLADTADQASVGILLDQGYGLLQFDLGQGLVTVLADNAFVTNRHIGEEDHALALAMFTQTAPGGRIWLVHDVVMPSLLGLAWQHAAHLLAALLAAVVLWLWQLGTRLGPRLPTAQRPRRDFSEHLSASATYLWRLDRARTLFLRNRQHLLQAWLNKHYALRAMQPGQRSDWIAARSGLTPRAVERALHADYKAESEFIELTSYLQVLRETL